MLPRVLEPEVMDTPEEARDYDAMDHAEVNRRFVADFLAAGGVDGPILDLGTGTAQIPIELCRQSPRSIIRAVDAAEEMLRIARVSVARAGLGERIHLERADAKALPYPREAFAAVISNSLIHHIPDPQGVVAEMVRVCHPGGRLFVRDLCRPADLATLELLVRTYAAGANDHQQALFAASLHAALTLDEMRGIIASLGLDPEGVQMTSDRHWTWSAVKPGSGVANGCLMASGGMGW